MAIKLTEREKEIISLIAKELTTAKIAEYLHISPSTVETHRRNLFRKLGVQSSIGLLKEAIKHGYIAIKNEDED